MTKTSATYKLLDSGNFRKLEKVGSYLLDRPAPQAIWKPGRSVDIWKKADAFYERSSSGSGSWKYRNKIPESWFISYHGLVIKVKLTDFGHLGLFPEHASVWEWIRDKISGASCPVKLLNVFAYTGGASLAGASAGAEVTHLDAAKGIVSWARENAEASGLTGKPIRWIVDDAAKFISREIRRHNKYDALILDPPSYGRGSRGEVWKFESEISNLLNLCGRILADKPLFVILSAHTPGFSAIALANLLADTMRGYKGKLTCGDMTVCEEISDRRLPSGIIAKWEARCFQK
ncbi:MAG: class I SAM-dependent methyltransferase [Elusimicrobiota bacterium]